MSGITSIYSSENMNAFEALEPRIHLSRGAATRLTESASPPALVMTKAPASARLDSAVLPADVVSPAAYTPTDLSGSVPGTVYDGKLTIPYRFFVPQLSMPTQKVPLILFLHGFGDGGTDNVTQTYWMSKLRQSTPSGQNAAYILAPQNVDGALWIRRGPQPAKKPAEIETLVMSLMKQVVANQPNID